MNFFDLLKKHTTSFTRVKRVELEALKTDLIRSMRATRENPAGYRMGELCCRRLIEAYPREAANMDLMDLLSRMSVHSDVSPAASVAAVPTLGSTPQEIDAFIFNEWSFYLNEQLADEDHPLEALMTLVLDDVSLPMQFASFLVCLVNKPVGIELIIQSGLLHQFFALHCHHVEFISASYDLLSASNVPQIQELLRQAEQISPNVRGYEQYSLCGTRSTLQALRTIEPHVFTTSITPVHKNIAQLHQLLGIPFLLHLFDQVDFPSRTYRQDMLRKSTDWDLASIYQHIRSQRTGIEACTLLKAFSQELSSVQLLFLLNHGSSWPLLAMSPQSHVMIDLNTWIERNPLKIQDIAFAASLCQQGFFVPYRDRVYTNILNVLFENPRIDLDDKLLRALQQWEGTASWCAQKVSSIGAQLKQCIRDHTAPFTEVAYLSLQDRYRLDRASLALLRTLSEEKVDYPVSTHEFHALIMETAFETDASMTLDDYLSIVLTPMTGQYTPEECQQADLRTTLECLVYTKNQRLQDALIERLVLKGQLQSIDHVAWFKQACLHHNPYLLHTFFKGPEAPVDKIILMTSLIEEMMNQNTRYDAFRAALSLFSFEIIEQVLSVWEPDDMDVCLFKRLLTQNPKILVIIMHYLGSHFLNFLHHHPVISNIFWSYVPSNLMLMQETLWLIPLEARFYQLTFPYPLVQVAIKHRQASVVDLLLKTLHTCSTPTQFLNKFWANLSFSDHYFSPKQSLFSLTENDENLMDTVIALIIPLVTDLDHLKALLLPAVKYPRTFIRLFQHLSPERQNDVFVKKIIFNPMIEEDGLLESVLQVATPAHRFSIVSKLMELSPQGLIARYLSFPLVQQIILEHVNALEAQASESAPKKQRIMPSFFTSDVVAPSTWIQRVNAAQNFSGLREVFDDLVCTRAVASPK